MRSGEEPQPDSSIAYVTSDSVAETPFAVGFRVIEDFPLDEKTLKRELAARHIGTLQIKKRGVDLDPALPHGAEREGRLTREPRPWLIG